MFINLIYEASVANAPIGFKTALSYAVDLLDATFTNPIKINISVGWGSVNGSSLGPANLGSAVQSTAGLFSYAEIENRLAANTAKSTTDIGVLANLSSTDPTNGAGIMLGRAEAKALGLIGSNSIDGWIGFSSSLPFTYDPNNRAVPGLYDFIGTALHEITHLMGRTTGVGGTGPTFLDLFRYGAPGVRELASGQAAYFSIDGGVTNLNNFNSIGGGDYADWSSSAGSDSFLAFSSAGKLNAMTATDIEVMDALGWNTVPSPVIASITVTGSGIVNGSGDLGVGASMILTVAVNTPISVVGTPTLTLNTGGTAVYSGGSGGSNLTFLYTVQISHNASDLAVSALNLNGGTIRDNFGNDLNLAGATGVNPAGLLQIDGTAPEITSIVISGTSIVGGSGTLTTGASITFAVNFSEIVTVSAGLPSLALNDGQIATYSGGSGTSVLTFSHTVVAGERTDDLSILFLGLNGASITDPAGNPAVLTAAIGYQSPGILRIDTTNHLSIAPLSADKAPNVSSPTAYTFVVTLDHAPQSQQSVDWSVSGSGSHPASAMDFLGGVLPAGTINFLAGETSKTIEIDVSSPILGSVDEGFTVTLMNPSSGLSIDSAASSGSIQHLKVVGYDDAYVALQGQAVSAAQPIGVLANDEGVSTTTALLLNAPSHGVLSLSANGSFNYTADAGFTGVDTFTYRVSSDGGTDDRTATIYTVPINEGVTATLDLLSLTAEEQVAATYVAFFSRGADKVGFEFWVDLFLKSQLAAAPLTLFASLASSFGLSAEARALYPFLANPVSASDSQIGDFLDSVYHNLFNRAGDTAGLIYWTGQIKQTLAAGKFVGDVLLNIIGGAQNNTDGQDITTLMNKVAVGLEYVHLQQELGTSWSFAQDGASSVALIHAVTLDPQTVLIGIKQADLLLKADQS